MKLLYDGEVIGSIVTNRSLTVMEACELLNIDLKETEPSGEPVWDYELFEMDYSKE